MKSDADCRDHPGKVGYESHSLAKHALRTIRHRTKRGQHIPVRTYHCGECQMWFLTSSGREGRWV